MADSKTKKSTAKVGDLWDVPQGSVVRRPDGSVFTIGQGGHVLDVEGDYTNVDNDGNDLETVTVK